MKVFLDVDGVRTEVLPTPEPGAPAVRVEVDCPGCRARSPIEVRGQGVSERGHDEYRAVAVHVGCGARVGKLVAQVDTIFGLEEDERVLRGRCRVY